MSSTTLPVCPKTGSTSPSLTVHLCLHTAPGNRECARSPLPGTALENRSPLILPANLSIDDSRVQFELTRYLPDNWVPVIEKDVDGQSALPQRLDGEIANLGKFSACRRVARTVYLGSAPAAGAAQRGLEDRCIKLGCVLPGESPAVFGDALRRLAAAATYLYQDGPRYWYDMRPTVTKLAEDRAEQLPDNPASCQLRP